MVDRFCRGCQYLGHVSGGYCCEYLAITGSVRGCPSGTGCTQYVSGGRMPSIAALETVGKAAERLAQRPMRERQDWDEYMARERERRERSAKNCAAKCRGRQQAALRAYLDKRGITMKALGIEIGVSPGTVHRWMREVCLADWGKLAAVGCAKPEGL